jgi:homoserine/homoserine lactone efflux protein
MHLAAFALTELVLSLTPGPAVLLVVSQAVTSGFRASVRGALGIIAGNAIYFGLSALGLSALLIASEGLFNLIRIAGAAYLGYIGLRLVLSRPETSTSQPVTRGGACFRQGLLTQLLNPKALLFFTALLPQFVVSDQGTLAAQFAALAVISICVELPVLLAFGWLADRGRQRVSPRWAALGERTAGAILIGTGLNLAFRQAP